MDPASRASLERRFKMLRGEQIADDAWTYELTDTSRDTLGALVREPSVADTHFIDRTTLEFESGVPHGPRRPGPLGTRAPRAAFALVDRGPILLILFAAVAALFAFRRDTVPTPDRVVRFLTRGIPALSPRDLGVFRLAFGVALLLYIYQQPFPLEPIPRALQRGDVQLGALAPMQWLAAHPQIVRAGQWTAILSAALFAIGIVPRLFYAMAVAGTVQWLLAFSLQSDSHPFGVFLLPLLGLLAAPWHAAPPLWAIGRNDGPPDRRNGFAPWFVGLALGVAWAGAAWAKLRGGPGWVLNGTVRYHFVTDYRNAHVDWNLAIAAMPLVAIALSAGTVLIEALTVAAAFTKPPAIRLAAGLAAASVLVGFYLFQGIMWPAWWVLLLGFLPWHWQHRADTRSPQSEAWSLSRAQILLIVALLVQQFVVSAAFLEFPPLASRYDMYSTTHESPEAFDRDNPGISRRIVAVDARGATADATSCTFPSSDPVPPTVPAQACDTGNLTPAHYLVLESQCLFDWKAGRPYCPYRDKVIATVAISN